jgi:hypothetical protein
MKRERECYGLSPQFTESKTEILDGHIMLAWTWGSEHNSLTTGGPLWVNWFLMDTFEWHRISGESGVTLARHDCRSWPPTGEHEITPEQWRDADFQASGFVKWDGCAQWDCDVHLDSRDERQRFFDAVHLAHQRAAEIMVKNFDGKAEEA